MTRYFFHLRDRKDGVLDPEGIDLPSDAIAGAALMAARDCMAGDVMRGKLDLRYRIDVHDGDGSLVQSVPFVDALEVVSAS